MKNKTVLMAAVLAVAAVFAAGLTVLPVQNAQADFDVTDICEDNDQTANGDAVVNCEDFYGVFRGDNWSIYQMKHH